MTATAQERLPGEHAVLPLAGGENFPVALRVLGPRVGAHLTAIYGFARLVDQIGDEVGGERLALLDELDADLAHVFDRGEPTHALLQRLVPTVRACEMPREPFLRLIEANRRDQSVVAYETFDDLLGYCELSANPVGELVLYVFDAATPERIALSDRICSALQVIEHCQDVGEDATRGRVYVPAEDLARFGVEPADLRAAVASEAVLKLLAFEIESRVRPMLDAGAPLVGTLRGRARLAVAGYVGGGRANADAVVGARDVLAFAPRAGGAARLRELLHAWRTGR
jgi:squalene synthase HpnC